MSVWFCIPSGRPAAEADKCLSLWRGAGYKIALWRDPGAEEPQCGDLIISAPYPGYAKAVNKLVATVLASDASCDWVVTGGDDTWPDPNHTPEQIAAECSQYFGLAFRHTLVRPREACRTFGVMQPTGDPWADHMGRIIERIAGSPWIGRQFACLINAGGGPYWEEYRHNWLDEEIMLVAQKLGCFWQRRDITHFHDHCLRYPGGKWAPHLHWVSDDYRQMKPLFEARKKMGFPGSDPL